MFSPPPDTATEDPSSPPGTITVEVHDADDKPMPAESVTLGTMIQSVAKGDSRRHETQTTGKDGRVIFSGLDSGSAYSYRIVVAHQGGGFSPMPFRLEEGKAERVIVHVYDVLRDVNAFGRIDSGKGARCPMLSSSRRRSA